MITEGHQLGEVAMDSRHRLPMASLKLQHAEENVRYRVTEYENGELRLTPVYSVSAEELAVLRNPEMLASLLKGIADADAGNTSIVDFDSPEWQNLDDEKDD